eukprot:Clim_evm39s204 gene=Clim_evmTU39s204
MLRKGSPKKKSFPVTSGAHVMDHLTRIDTPEYQEQAKTSGLVRLVLSELFDCHMAIDYLERYPEGKIQILLCKKILRYPAEEVSFYLPQLVHIYIKRVRSSRFSVSEVENTLLCLCAYSWEIAFLTVCLLDTYLSDPMAISSKAQVAQLRDRILHTAAQFDYLGNLKGSTGDMVQITSPVLEEGPEDVHNLHTSIGDNRSNAGTRINSSVLGIADLTLPRTHSHKRAKSTNQAMWQTTQESKVIAQQPASAFDTPTKPAQLQGNMPRAVSTGTDQWKRRQSPKVKPIALQDGFVKSNQSLPPINVATGEPLPRSMGHLQSIGLLLGSGKAFRGSPSGVNGGVGGFHIRARTLGSGTIYTPPAIRSRKGPISKENLVDDPLAREMSSGSDQPQISTGTLQKDNSDEKIAVPTATDKPSDGGPSLPKSRSSPSVAGLIHQQGSPPDKEPSPLAKHAASERSPRHEGRGRDKMTLTSPVRQRSRSQIPTSGSKESDPHTDSSRDAALDLYVNSILMSGDRVAIENFIFAQERFVWSLMFISYKLVKFPTREARKQELIANLKMLNLSLPSNVYLPIFSGRQSHHHVLRIPSREALILNSKDRVPIMVFVEVQWVNNRLHDPCPIKRPEHSLSRSPSMLSSLSRESMDGSETASISGDFIEGLGGANGAVSTSSSSRLRVPAMLRRQRQGVMPATNFKTNLPEERSSTSRQSLSGGSLRNSDGDMSHDESPAGGATPLRGSLGDLNRPAVASPLSVPTSRASALGEHNGDSANSGAEDDGGLSAAREDDISYESEEGMLTLKARTTNTNSDTRESVELVNADIGDTKVVTAIDVRKRLEEECGQNRSILDQCALLDPSGAELKSKHEARRERIRRSSPYGDLPGWDLVSMIVKTGDDLRQEQFASQLIQQLANIWHEEDVKLWLNTYRVLSVSKDAGLIETVVDSMSLHSLKTQTGKTLLEWFCQEFGETNTEPFMEAQTNFVRSAAAYSLVTYLLQVKDRHNGNILLDRNGHMIHIDFGFLLGKSPRNLNFETAPFKLTSEMVELLGGIDSDMFKYYQALILQGLLAARKHKDKMLALVHIMQTESTLPCFDKNTEVATTLDQRLGRNMTEEQMTKHVQDLIVNAFDNGRTKWYDTYQWYTNGIR